MRSDAFWSSLFIISLLEHLTVHLQKITYTSVIHLSILKSDLVYIDCTIKCSLFLKFIVQHWAINIPLKRGRTHDIPFLFQVPSQNIRWYEGSLFKNAFRTLPEVKSSSLFQILSLPSLDFFFLIVQLIFCIHSFTFKGQNQSVLFY